MLNRHISIAARHSARSVGGGRPGGLLLRRGGRGPPHRRLEEGVGARRGGAGLPQGRQEVELENGRVGVMTRVTS